MRETFADSFEGKVDPVKAMVLAAGKGTRLYPLTGEIPKPMAPIVDTPIIQHIFELLAKADIGEVHVNIHYLADVLLEAYGETSRVNSMNIHLSREDELLGTAGGVKRLEENFDDTFVVIMGDALTDIDIRELVAFHKEKGSLATIALKRVHDTSEYGVVELDPEVASWASRRNQTRRRRSATSRTPASMYSSRESSSTYHRTASSTSLKTCSRGYSKPGRNSSDAREISTGRILVRSRPTVKRIARCSLARFK